jgi:hypothetical protein
MDCAVSRVVGSIGGAQCLGTVALAHGQITFHGRFEFELAHLGSFEAAITGGSGEYLGAVGTVVLSNNSLASLTSDVTIRLR